MVEKSDFKYYTYYRRNKIMEEKRKGKGAIIVILILIILGMAAYICYEKGLILNNNTSSENTTQEDNTNKDTFPEVYSSLKAGNYLVFNESKYHLVYTGGGATEEKTGEVTKTSDDKYDLGDISLETYEDVAIVKNLFEPSPNNGRANLVLFKLDIKEVKDKLYSESVEKIKDYYSQKGITTKDISLTKVEDCANYDNDDNMVCYLEYNITFENFNASECINSEKYGYEVGPLCNTTGIVATFPVRFGIKDLKFIEMASFND